MRMLHTSCLTALLLCLTACGIKSDPKTNEQEDAGAGSGSGGSGGSDAGDAGGEGGTTGGTGGTTGGSGGSDSDAAIPECEDHNECPATRPQCTAAGRCAVCTSSDVCEGRDGRMLCELASSSTKRGECVACLADDDCDGNEDGEYCNNNACVPCKTNVDCDDLSEPQCTEDGQCTGCTSSEACEGRDDTEACMTEAGPTRGHCVACVENSDCKEADEPQCQSNNTCGGCTTDEACEDRDGTEHCNVREDADTFGECVECTGATEDEECGTKSCKQTTGECTDTDQGSRNSCEACEADSECSGTRECVVQSIGDNIIGSFCFSPAPTSGCASVANDDLKPYSRTLLDIRSIDSASASEAADFCVPPTSCQAYTDATTSMMAPGARDCDVSNDCGVGDSEIDAAFCIPDDFIVVAARSKCSYGCETGADCPEAGFSNCPDASPRFCRP